MIVVGLTGSIGMGKSTTAAMFAEAGIPVYDADAEVAALYAPGGAAVPLVEQAFPGVVREGAVDKQLLAERVVHDPAALAKLTQEIVYPLLPARREAFFEAARAAGVDIVVLDVPLLFETGGEKNVDVVVVAAAPAELQRERVLSRPGMTPVKLDAILAKQLPDADKRARADFVVDTSKGLEAARQRVAEIIATLRRRTTARDPVHR